jgi:hypothetical protein
MKTCKCFIVLVTSVFICVNLKANTMTLTASNQMSASFGVPSNVVAQVTHASCGTASGSQLAYKINVVINGQTNAFFPIGSSPNNILNLPTIVGPATITLVNTYNSSPPALAVCTIQTDPATSTLNFTPSTAVVIPNDNGGPVTIVLESSTDLINWTPALPGTYGTTSSNRFFRVRATR